MRELEARLAELEGRHTDTLRSYEALQHECSSIKQELERLRKERGMSSSSYSSEGSSRKAEYAQGEWEESKVEMLDPLLFDVSAYCFEQDYGQGGK